MERRYYKEVAANTTDTDEYIPASGKVVYFKRFGGSGSSVPATIIKIIWDYGGTETLLFSTHGNFIDEPSEEVSITGDGTKKLTIVLINDQAESDALGGFWNGDEV